MTSLGGVTIHIGPRSPCYASLRLCDRNVEAAPHRTELLRVDPAINHALAVRADAAKGAGGLAQDDALGHVPGGHLGRAAWQAEDAAGVTRLPGARPASSQEAAKFKAAN